MAVMVAVLGVSAWAVAGPDAGDALDTPPTVGVVVVVVAATCVGVAESVPSPPAFVAASPVLLWVPPASDTRRGDVAPTGVGAVSTRLGLEGAGE